MDKRKNNGGGYRNQGRKKGIGISFDIKRHCDNMIREMLKDDAIRLKATNQLCLSLFEEKKESYLYIIKTNEKYKIGFTKNWNNRKKSYETHLPEYKIIYLIKILDAFNLEEYLHLLFKDKKVKGEWFNLSNEDIISAVTYCSKKIS